MATATPDSYSVAAGMPIYAGRPGPNARVSIQGQSNALGVGAGGDLNSAPLNADAGLYMQYLADFNRVYIFNAAGTAYEKLRFGVNQQAYMSDRIGPEFGLALRWMRETTTGKLFIDKETGDGQPISYFQQGGSFFGTSQSRRTAADAWLLTNGMTARDAGWLWVQGESDWTASQATYQTALQTLISGRIAGGLQTSSAKCLLVQMRPGTDRYGAGVDAAKVAYAASNPVTRLILMAASFEGDNLHLSARGQLQLGYDAFEKLFDAGHTET